MWRIERELTGVPALDGETFQARYEQCRMLVELAADVIYSVDADFRLSYVSPSVEKHLGYMPQELTGKLFSELGLLTEDSLARAIEDTMRILNGEELKSAEYDIIAKDGTVRRTEVRSTPVYSNGRVASIVSVARDITLQRNAEQTLAESEKRFRTMAERLTDGLIIMERGEIVYVNDRACHLCGYPRHELVQLWGPDLTAPQSVDQKNQILQQTSDTGTYPEQADIWITRKDGTRCCLNLRFAFDYSAEKKQSGYVLMTDITERMLHSEKMQDTMEFLDDIIGKSVDAIVITQPEGVFKRVNQSFLELTGYSDEEVIGKRVADFSAVIGEEYEMTTGERISMDQDYMDYTLKMAEQLLDQKKIVNWESYLVRKDGKVVPIEMNISYIFDKQGDVSGCVGILRDNTDRKIAEKEIIETRDFLNNIIDSSLDPIIIGSNLGNIARVNKAFENLTGYDSQTLMGKHLAELVPPRAGLYKSIQGTTVKVEEEFYDRAYEQMKSLIETGHIENAESFLYSRSGTVISVEQTMFYIFDKNGSRTGVVSLNRDITERKQAEKKLIETRNFLGDIIRTSADGILVTDTTGIITLANEAVERITGYDQKDLLGHNTHDFFQLADGELCSDFNRNASTQMNALYYCETRWKAKDGKKIDLGMSIGTLIDMEGSITGMVACLRDITERKAWERRLIDYQNQLRCLASQLTLTEEQERKRIALEIHDHVSQSLALAKIKLGAMAAAKTANERAREIRVIRELLEQSIRNTRSLIFNLSPPFLYEFGLEKALEWLLEDVEKEYGIRTRLVCRGAGGGLDDDVRILLYQSVRELLINVVKHAHAKTATVFLDRNGQMVHVSVEDDGRGFVVNPDGFRISSGGGFGIFSIRERFEYLGGGLTVESKLNRGTRIDMELPLVQH